MAKIECDRCGFEWHVATVRKKENFCQSCRATKVHTVDIGGDKCHPWLGRFDVDQVTPIDDNGNPIKPGDRLCGHSDCMNSRHIRVREREDGRTH